MHNGDHISIHGMVDIFHGFCVHRFDSCALQICPSHRKKEDYLNKLPAVPRLEFWGWSTGGSRREQKTAKKSVEDVQQTHAHKKAIRKLCIGSCSQLVRVCKSVKMITTWFSTTSNYRQLRSFGDSYKAGSGSNIWYV